MEVDRILYIFGSFTRKKQDKRKSFDQSSLSAGNSPLHIPRTPHRPLSQNLNHISQNLNIAPRTSAYGDGGKSQVMKDWECGICKKELVEPRLLGCLHSFCTRCLQGLHQEGEAEVWSEVDGVPSKGLKELLRHKRPSSSFDEYRKENGIFHTRRGLEKSLSSSSKGTAKGTTETKRSYHGSIQLDPGESGSGSGNGSAGSGYESDLRHSGSEGSWEQKPHKYGIFTRKISGKSVQFLLCPTCGHESQLPLGGVSALPLNYVLLRKMVAADHQDRASVLCDLCNCDNKAESRCSQCLVSVCPACGDAHGRHKSTARHSLRALRPPPAQRCGQHPRAELGVYCATCQQVVCRDCCLIGHSGHALANAARAAAERARLLRDACARAAHVPASVERAASNLNAHATEADAQAARVEAEVQTWAEQYRRAVDAHGRALCTAAARARARHRQRVEEQSKELEDRARHAVDAVKFAEELLSDAKEDELLSLSGPVLRRLERLSELQALAEPPRCELRFAPAAPLASDSTLCGRLLTQAPDSDQCVLDLEGLQDLRVDGRHEAIFELRDSGGERIWCGGEQVAGYFRRRDSSARPDMAKVCDRADGTYSIVFTPSSPGAYLLAVTLNNRPIKGSPFPCAVRVAPAHAGQFHCCAFCSSGGRRDVACGCGATMGGGYKGCGHGHAGWPGARHWSCCGSTQRHGGCARATTGARPRAKSQLYQFSL